VIVSIAGIEPGTGFLPGVPRLAYEAAGAGAPVVFLHGIGGNRTNWSGQLDVLAADYLAVAWDARGYGASDDYEGPLDFAEFSRDLLRLLDHLGADQAHLCGLSMGGRITLDFYDRYPQRVASLILADTFPGFDTSFTREARERFVRERRQPLVEGKQLADIAPLVAPTLVSPTASAAVVQKLVDSMCLLHKESYIKTIESMTMYGPVTDVSTIKVPVQIMVGADDKLTPPSIAKKMAAGIADVRLLILDDTGHLSNLENPQAFNTCIKAFLAEVS
jgi:3-oxoadipate enol-lactonase